MAHSNRSRRFVGRFDAEVEEAVEQMLVEEQAELEEAEVLLEQLERDWQTAYSTGTGQDDWDLEIFGFADDDCSIYLTHGKKLNLLSVNQICVIAPI